MRSVLLINIDRTTPRQRAEMEAILHGHEGFQAELQAAGKMIPTERLCWDGEASHVRVKAGRRFVTAGPSRRRRSSSVGST